MRLIRLLDDLLEILIFDVALATPRRRRVAAAIAAACGVVFYGISGLLFVPVVTPSAEIVDGAPYLLQEASGSFPDLLRVVAVERLVPAGRGAELERALEGQAARLDRLVSLLASTRPPALEQRPRYRELRSAAWALVARGVWHAEGDRGGAAMLQWFTALRLARVVAQGSVGRPANVLDGLVASAIEQEALKALTWYADWRMTPAEWGLMQRELRIRRAESKTLRDFMAGERAAAVRFFEKAHADGGFVEQELGIYLSRALLPLRQADRAAFVDEVRDRYLRVMDADIALTAGNATRAGRHELETDHALVLAPFSHEHAVTRMTNLIVSSMTVDYAMVGERLQVTERLARELEKFPEPLDLESI